MLLPYYNEPIQTYKSYKAERFNKYIERQRALITGVMESSLKGEDKKKLLKEMSKLIDLETIKQ